MEDLEESNAEPAASADAGRMTAFCASTALERPALLSWVVMHQRPRDELLGTRLDRTRRRHETRLR